MPPIESDPCTVHLLVDEQRKSRFFESALRLLETFLLGDLPPESANELLQLPGVRKSPSLSARLTKTQSMHIKPIQIPESPQNSMSQSTLNSVATPLLTTHP
jgi:hypothetical protein